MHNFLLIIFEVNDHVHVDYRDNVYRKLVIP